MPTPAKKASVKKTVKKTVKKSNSENKENDAFIEGLRKKGLLGDISKKVDIIPTGSWVINRIIGDGSLRDQPGGIPRGCITEIFGNESSGKTTIGLSIAKQAMNQGGIVVYADFEQTLRTQRQYIENMGINTNPPQFLHLIPTNFEDGVQAIGSILVRMKPALIVIDSVTAMIAKNVIEGSPEETQQIGHHARLTGNFLNWMTKKLPKFNTSLLLLNQVRSNIKGKYDIGPSEVSSGGNAVKFFTTVRIQLTSSSKKEEISVKNVITGIAEKKAISQIVKCVVKKNKFDVPFKSGPIYITFGKGIDNVMSLIVLGINKKVIKKAAAGWYTWKDPSSELELKAQGKNGVKEYLEAHPEILDAITPYLMPTQDDAEMDRIQAELMAKGVENLTPDELEQLRDIKDAKGEDTTFLDYDEEQLDDLSELMDLTGEK